MNELQECQVILKDMQLIKTTLMGVQAYLQASDIAKSQLNLFDPIKYSPLTQEVSQTLDRVNGLIGDALMASYETETEEEDDGKES
jgi:hypothetical protein